LTSHIGQRNKDLESRGSPSFVRSVRVGLGARRQLRKRSDQCGMDTEIPARICKVLAT